MGLVLGLAMTLDQAQDPAALVEAWHEASRSVLLPVQCTAEVVSSRHQAA
jgi:hypothetical protein